MNGSLAYKCILILIIQCVYCADKPNDHIRGANGGQANESGAEDDGSEDNFNVADVTGPPIFMGGAPGYASAYPQPPVFPHPIPAGQLVSFPPSQVNLVGQQQVYPGIPHQHIPIPPSSQTQLHPQPQLQPQIQQVIPPSYVQVQLIPAGYGIGYQAQAQIIGSVTPATPFIYQPVPVVYPVAFQAAPAYVVTGPIPGTQPTVPVQQFQHYQPVQPQGGPGSRDQPGQLSDSSGVDGDVDESQQTSEAECEGGAVGGEPKQPKAEDEIDYESYDLVVKDLESLDVEDETKKPSPKVPESGIKSHPCGQFVPGFLSHKYPSITLYGMNGKNELVQLGTHHHNVVSDTDYIVKVRLKIPICKLVSDGRTVWDHRPGLPQHKFFCYFKYESRFSFYSEKLVESCMMDKDLWICMFKEVPAIKFYKQNAQNELVEIGLGEMLIDYNGILEVRFNIDPSVDCVLVRFNEETLWEKMPNMVLRGLTYIDDNSMMLYICQREYWLRKVRGDWVLKRLPRQTKGRRNMK